MQVCSAVNMVTKLSDAVQQRKVLRMLVRPDPRTVVH